MRSTNKYTRVKHLDSRPETRRSNLGPRDDYYVFLRWCESKSNIIVQVASKTRQNDTFFEQQEPHRNVEAGDFESRII